MDRKAGRFLAVLLMMVLLLSVCASASAAHTHSVSTSCSTTGQQVTFEALDITSGTISADKNYYLDKDVTLTGQLLVDNNATVNLCLNGNVLKASSGKRIFRVNQGSTLSICDCNTSTIHKFDGTKKPWVLDPNGNKTVNGGVMTGGSDVNGGAVSLPNGGTLNLYGGTLVGNKATYNGGGAVYLSYAGPGYDGNNGFFNMMGGSIKGNYAVNTCGSAVAVWDSCVFTMTGGTIEENANDVNSTRAGAVTNSQGTLKLQGGKIINNTGDGGGVVSINAGYGFGGDPFVEISGDMIIAGNKTKSGETSNLTVDSSTTTSITGPLGPNADIGIQTSTPPLTIVSGNGYSMSASDVAKFTEDLTGESIVYDSSANQLSVGTAVTLTLDKNDGTGTTTMSAIWGAPLFQSIAVPTRAGFKFEGYYDARRGGNQIYDASGTLVYNGSIPYVLSRSVPGFSFMRLLFPTANAAANATVTGSFTLYARWSAISGGTGTGTGTGTGSANIPTTGDTSPIGLYLTLLALSVLCIGLMLRRRAR